jgi:hypothetical protein
MMPTNAKPTAANGGLSNSNENQRAAGFTYSIDQSGLVVNVKPFDLMAARSYFRGLESLAREARDTHDPRVIALALQIVSRDSSRVAMLMQAVQPIATLCVWGGK